MILENFPADLSEKVFASIKAKLNVEMYVDFHTTAILSDIFKDTPTQKHPLLDSKLSFGRWKKKFKKYHKLIQTAQKLTVWTKKAFVDSVPQKNFVFDLSLRLLLLNLLITKNSIQILFLLEIMSELTPATLYLALVLTATQITSLFYQEYNL